MHRYNKFREKLSRQFYAELAMLPEYEQINVEMKISDLETPRSYLPAGITRPINTIQDLHDMHVMKWVTGNAKC